MIIQALSIEWQLSGQGGPCGLPKSETLAPQNWKWRVLHMQTRPWMLAQSCLWHLRHMNWKMVICSLRDSTPGKQTFTVLDLFASVLWLGSLLPFRLHTWWTLLWRHSNIGCETGWDHGYHQTAQTVCLVLSHNVGVGTLWIDLTSRPFAHSWGTSKDAFLQVWYFTTAYWTSKWIQC